MDRRRVIILDILNGFPDVGIVFGSLVGNDFRIPQHNGQELIHQALDQQVIGFCGMIIAQYFKNNVPQFPAMGALERHLIAAQPHMFHAFRGQPAVKSHPQIGPGIFGVGLIEALPAGLDQEAVSSGQLIAPVSDLIAPLAGYNIMQQIIGPDCRTPAVQLDTFFIAAVAEMQICEFTGFGLKKNILIHVYLYLQKSPCILESCPAGSFPFSGLSARTLYRNNLPVQKNYYSAGSRRSGIDIITCSSLYSLLLLCHFGI